MNDIKHSILHINTYGTSGGAGKAAYRLHKGLLSLGENSRYLTRESEASDPTISIVAPDDSYQRDLETDAIINTYYIAHNRTAISNTYFSFSYPGYDVHRNKLVNESSIINLHWVEDFLSPLSLHAIWALDKPVVWTLHDQKPFTGGCHFSAGCIRYRDYCDSCPQLADDPFHLPSAVLQDKLELFKGANLTIVAPSTWLSKEASSSNLFNSHRIEVIPNSVETDIYHPVAKEKAKRILGIDPDTLVIMFGTADATEWRKGFKHLLTAVHGISKDAQCKQLIASGRLLVLCAGQFDGTMHEVSLPIRHLGFVADDHRMATIYNASDLLVLPSLEDNLPNTMLEAMSCGTPVIAFNVGGMPDVIKNGINGKLVECGNDEQLGSAIIDLLLNDADRRRMGEASSVLIKEKFNPQVQANAYRNLYNDLPNQNVPHRVHAISSSKRYGDNTLRLYGKLLRFAIRNKLRIQYNVRINNRLILYIVSFMLRRVARIIPIKMRYHIKALVREKLSSIKICSIFIYL